MTILLEDISAPATGRFELAIQRTIHLHVTADQARQRVNGWVLDDISHMMGAEEAVLVLCKEQAFWRVPVVLTAPHVGKVGEVGVVHVNVETGEMDNGPERIDELQKNGAALGNRLPIYTPRSTDSPDYLATDLQPTHPHP